MWLRGDCHLHTRRSYNAELSPTQVLREAQQAGLDYVVVTEHDAYSPRADWPHEHPVLVIPGSEQLSERGHRLHIGSRWGDDPQERLPLSAAETSTLTVAAHPFAPYPSGTFQDPPDSVDALEVWNGLWASDLPWQADNARALDAWADRLREGSRIAVVGGSDAHLPNQPGHPLTVVHTRRQEAAAIVRALKQGHSWIAEDSTIDLRFAIAAGRNRTMLGQIFTPGRVEAAVHIAVDGASEGRLSILNQDGAQHSEAISAGRPFRRSIALDRLPGNSSFLRLELRHQDGAIALLTNPIWLSPSGTPPRP